MIIEEIHISDKDNNYIAIVNNKAYEINKYYYSILDFIQKGKTKEEAIDDLKTKESLDKSELILIKQSFDNFITNISGGTTNRSYIKYSVTLFNEEVAKQISNCFILLFHKYIFTLLLTISIVANTYFLLYTNRNTTYGLEFSITELWILFILSNIFIVFHEIGHSTASLKFKLPSKKIGFGFYFIFPVFFSDVTNIWLLNKKDRIIVNIAGIYFQLLLNLFFITFFFFINDALIKGILLYFITSNLFVSIYSLIPFFRNDGYWIYSDLFNITNLLKKAERLTLVFLHRRIIDKKEKSEYTIPLVLFTMSNWIFKIYIIYKLSTFIIDNISNLHNSDMLFDIVMNYLGICISAVGIYMIFRVFYRLVTNKTKTNELF
jgi:putative peptide zinc metalloprotease protein